MVTIHDKTFTALIKKEVLFKRIEEIAAELDNDYRDKKPLFIVILNGAFIFAAGLFQSLNISAEICFVRLSSYEGISSTEHVNTILGLDKNITGRDIIILEDIIDTGRTLHSFIPHLLKERPSS